MQSCTPKIKNTLRSKSATITAPASSNYNSIDGQAGTLQPPSWPTKNKEKQDRCTHLIGTLHTNQLGQSSCTSNRPSHMVRWSEGLEFINSLGRRIPQELFALVLRLTGWAPSPCRPVMSSLFDLARCSLDLVKVVWVFQRITRYRPQGCQAWAHFQANEGLSLSTYPC